MLTSGDIISERAPSAEAETLKGDGDPRYSSANLPLLRFPTSVLLCKAGRSCRSGCGLMRTSRPGVVFANAYEAAHPDHDS